MRNLAGFGCVLALAATAITPPAWADIIPPKSYSVTPGGMNAADGSFVYSVTDLSIGTLKLERYHRTGLASSQPNDPFFGKNLSHNFDIFAAVNPKPAPSTSNLPIVHIGNSASGTYVQFQSNMSLMSPNNGDAETGFLEWTGGNSLSTGNYVYTDREGNVYTFSRTVKATGTSFDQSQRVSQIAFADGRLQTFGYNAAKQLKLVEDSSGYAILFDYNAAGDVSAACGFNRAINYVSVSSTCTGAALKVTYGYTSGFLTSVVDVNGQTTTYTNAYPGITCVKPPGYASCKISNVYSSGKISSQTLAGSGTWHRTGSIPPIDLNDPGATIPYDGDNDVTVTDPAGKVTSMTFSKTSPYTMRDALNRLSQFRFDGALYFDYFGPFYHDGTMLIEATWPLGDRYLAEYNGPYRSITKRTRKARPGTGLADLVEELGYNSCLPPATRQNCGKPIWIEDARNNRTDFTYAAHGGMMSEMKPAPSAGAARPLRLMTWVQKHAYIKNSSGTLVPAASPLWLIATETQCQTVAGSSSPTCDAAAPHRVTTYEYGLNGTANNLNVRGIVVTADGISRRTCFLYDNSGNRIAETRPRAALGSCP